MSEVQSRPAARGRTPARSGRGTHGSRPRTNKQTNGDSAVDTSADEGELGELKRRHAQSLSLLKELFPDWTDVDLVLAIEDSGGDVQATIEKITEGTVSQFAEVKKTKDRSRSKVKDSGAPADAPPHTRGGGRPSRGGESGRGGRARGTERGRGGFRGSRGGATNGTRLAGASSSVPTVESPAWDNIETATEPKDEGHVGAGEPPIVTEAPKAAVAAAPPKKTWASMFAKPKPAPAPPKPAAQAPVVPEVQAPPPTEIAAQEEVPEAAVEPEEPSTQPAVDEPVEEPQIAVEDVSNLTPERPDEAGPEITLAPSKDELTKDNVEHLPDESHPPPTETTASTVAGSADIGSIAGVATPLSTSSQAPIGRPAVGGFATTALKATGAPHRSASFQRRLIEQQEAVVMPGNHAVDRAAVQFGSLGLNGDLDADALDVDEDREEAETRTQPPQHSPVAPRASLPPAPRQAPQVESQPQEPVPTPKQAPGLPPPSQQHQPAGHQIPLNPVGAQAMQTQGSQGAQSYNQFGRYGQPGIPSEPSAPPQKPYDPFGQQAPQSNQYDYPNQQSQNLPHQQQPQSQAGGFSTADAFSSQLTSDQQRSAYQNYYHSYGQQNTPSQQEAGSAQQRTGSAFGTGPSDSAFPQGQQGQQQQAQGRYNDAQNSGHTTPNPALGQHPTGPSSQQGMHQPHAQPGQAGAYPYNHPYYGSPYYAAYVSQYGSYAQQQAGYGGFGGKGMYGQPHHYGMSPQAAFDQHSSSPANAGGFGQSSIHGRDSTLGGGLGEYGRSVSGASQTQHSATAAAAGFGGLPDTFGRPQGYPNQNASYGQQQGGQQGSNDDSLRPFGDSKSGGPSPSALGAQPGRPGSATNNTPGQTGQGGLPQQSHQQGFGGYPGHLNQGQGNQYGALGGLGHQGAGSHQSGAYGQYSGFGGGGYGSYNRGGWGTNYGQQQH